jgi:hypothetical protein
MQIDLKLTGIVEEEYLLKEAISTIQDVALNLGVKIDSSYGWESCVQKLIHFSYESSKNLGVKPSVDRHFAKWLVQNTIVQKNKQA